MQNSKIDRNIKPFDGDRYSVWKLRIRALLNELDVIKVIDDNVPAKLTDEWKKAERTAKGVIVGHLSDSFLSFVTDKNTAKEILKNLDEIYERESLASQLVLRKRLIELKLQGDTPLIKHFSIFDDLVTELSAAGAALQETEKISYLLVTLPKAYDGIITAIETLSTNLTLALVKTKLLDYEVKLKGENSDTSVKVLHANNFQSRKSSKNYKKGQYREKSLKPYYKSSNIKCHHCGRKGHMKKDCFHYKKGLQFKKSDRNKTIQTVQVTNRPSTNEGTSSFAFMIDNNKYEDRNGDKNKITFLLDSGASDHIINRNDLTQNFIELPTPIKIYIAKNGAFVNATKKGNMTVTSDLDTTGTLEDVLYCPDVPYNLLSVRKMQEAGMTIVFNNKGVEISKNNKIIIKGKSLNNLIGVDFIVKKEKIKSIAQANSNINSDYELWHQRLGHIGKSKFLELKNKNMIEDIGLIDLVTPNNNLCEACINGKQARLPFNKNKNKSHIRRPLFIVHSDVCGPITPSTINNKNYFVLFVDEFTHYCVTYLITYKSEVFSVFKDYVAKSEAYFNLKLVNLYCDNGREYLSNEMKDYCVQKGISYHLTVPRTPQLNGVSERMVRTITERARTMIVGANLDKSFWGEAVLTATFLINLTPTKALKLAQTPYELWHGKKPQVKFLRIFGSTVYIHNKTRTTKFEEKSLKGILVGFEPNGYKVWVVETEKFIIVRDVIVDETNFLKSRPVVQPERVNVENSGNKNDASDLRSKSLIKSHKSDEKSDRIKRFRSETGASDMASKPVVKSDVKKSDVTESIVEENVKLGREPNKSVIETDGHTEWSPQVKQISKLRRSDRLKGRPNISYNEDDYLVCAQSIVCKIPTSYQEIKNRDDRGQWEQAIKDEINSLLINKTWSLVEKPNNKNIVDCKWVFAIKNDEFGNPVKYKARLVARGFSQQYLTDYNETFAPVARISSFRFILAFANQFDLLIHHMDVKTAFLNGELEEEIFMKVPEGVKSKENQVCKLNKALYGLKQAARCWFQKFEKALKDKGFKNSSADRCIYILDKGNISKNIYIVLYVDDVVIATADINTMNSFKNYLMNKFCMTDLKEIKLILGIRINRTNNKITLDQSAYIGTILSKFNMVDCKPVSTPLESKLNYEALNSDEKYDAPCRNLIGCLMYVMLCTRPDLSISVNILSRYLNKNNRELWQCLKRILRYLKGSINIKLTYVRGDYKDLLTGYVDSDWGGSNHTDRKSTTGYLFKLFEKNTICWSTKRQTSVAASSTEAEYMALYEAVREALWIKSLAISININISEPIIIYEDNSGCISIANNPTNHKRSKHIDIKYHFSREQIENNVIKLKYIPTGNQLADILTKPLPAVKFAEFTTGMGLE